MNTRLFRILSLLAAIALCTGTLAGCGQTQTPETVPARNTQFFAMDTFMDITAYGGPESAAEEARTLIENLEARVSVTNPESELYRLNRDGCGIVSPETARLLRTALDLCALTDGALDISVYPIVRAWGFTTDEHHIPSDNELSELLKHVNYREIRLENTDGTSGNSAESASEQPAESVTDSVDGTTDSPDGVTVTLAPGMEIDLGAVAKGYAGKIAAQFLRESGVRSALLSLGGNVQTVGSKLNGLAWRVAVQDPNDPDDFAGVLELRDLAAVTSGGYQRYFTGPDGTTYWHIMDPKTGYPARSGLLSVTVVSGDGALCDALSTALFVMGAEEAERFWRTHRALNFGLVLITDNREILTTPDLTFSLMPGSAYSRRVIGE